ncbi:MAG TPA: DNA polymerase IV [Candidatus Moranbacteria bacterium]|nr:DNA polymerase IV [Candidatus Moranbacteria bacterium]
MRIIAHLDLDAFFASVEERDNPRLNGRPIVVGSDPMEGHGRGVVSTANYAAREYGIRSAVPISRAWQMSQKALHEGKPEAVFLCPDFSKYSKTSDAVMEIIRKYSDLVEQASIDEAYFDLSYLLDENSPRAKLLEIQELSSGNAFEKAEEICRKIKREIKEKEKITASIGLGPNKLIAKIASDMQKPDGLTVILPEKVEEFLEPLSIRKIPGIGPVTEKKFNEQGIFFIKDLKKYSKKIFEENWGSELYNKIRGIDESELVEEWEAKSIGEQETFQEDTLDIKTVMERMDFLCRSVWRRFQGSGFRSYKNVTVTVRFSNFVTKSRSHTLPKWEKTLKILKIESMKLIIPFFDGRENPKRRLIRLIGVRIEKLK